MGCDAEAKVVGLGAALSAEEGCDASGSGVGGLRRVSVVLCPEDREELGVECRWKSKSQWTRHSPGVIVRSELVSAYWIRSSCAGEELVLNAKASPPAGWTVPALRGYCRGVCGWSWTLESSRTLVCGSKDIILVFTESLVVSS